jgi:hypothetical protein
MTVRPETMHAHLLLPLTAPWITIVSCMLGLRVSLATHCCSLATSCVPSQQFTVMHGISCSRLSNVNTE